MQNMINYLADQWQRSGNPAWFKACMIALLIALIIFIARAIWDMLREYQRIQQLDQMQEELAKRYKKQFNDERRISQ